jgi:hypothetical protein
MDFPVVVRVDTMKNTNEFSQATGLPFLIGRRDAVPVGE